MATIGLGHNCGPALREGTWIAISRDLIEHHIVGAGNMVAPADKNRGAFSRLESWLDLLCMGNFAEREISVSGVTLILRPGQTVAGRALLARRWNWTEKTVRSWLARLEAELMITLTCETLKTKGQGRVHSPNVLSVCNWTKYQGEVESAILAQGPPKGQERGQPKGQEMGQRTNDATDWNIGANCYSSPVEGPAQGPGEGPAQGPHYNKIKNKTQSAHAHASAGVHAREAKPFFEDPYDRAVLKDGKLELKNGFRQEWLSRFGDDPVSLDLALEQIVPYVEPNSRRTMEAQVNAQLARIARQDREVSKRSEASRRKAPASGRASILEAIDRINAEAGK